jgi:hypothetical protein
MNSPKSFFYVALRMISKVKPKNKPRIKDGASFSSFIDLLGQELLFMVQITHSKNLEPITILKISSKIVK